MNHSVQIIGTYTEDFQQQLKQRGIDIESVIDRINPITIGFPADETKQIYCEGTLDASGALDIKKNLRNMLSRREDSFDCNEKFSGAGNNERKVNTTEYIIVYNSYINAKLLEDNGRLYTYREARHFHGAALENRLVRTLEKKEGALKDFEYLKMVDWKKFYDNVIAAILEEYEPKHIILIKSNVGPWYVDSNGIQKFDKEFIEYKNLVTEMDNYFVEKTNCICLDDLGVSVSDRNPSCIAPFALRSVGVFSHLADKVADIIEQNAFLELQNSLPAEKNDAMGLSLAEQYVRNQNFTKETLCHIEDYIENYECDIQDIITIYQWYQENYIKYSFETAINSLLKNRSCVYRAELERFESNRNYLKKYENISKEIEYMYSTDVRYVRLEHGFYLKISGGSNAKIELLSGTEKAFFEIRQKEMYCDVNDAEIVCGSLAFYIERARNGYGNIPLRLYFSNSEELCAAMHYVDFVTLLESEPFIIEVAEKVRQAKEYKVRTDLSFLFQKKVRIFFISNGIADQLRYYLFSKIAAEEDAQVYYDDIRHRRLRFRGIPDVRKIIKEDIDDRCFSNIFSSLLLQKNFNNVLLSADILYQAGLKELKAVSIEDEMFGNSKLELYNAIKVCPKLLFAGTNLEDLREIKYEVQYLAAMPYLSYLDEKYKKYIDFFKYSTKQNEIIAEKMLACDAVVIHVRRGDYLSLGWTMDMDFYRESMKKLMEIPDYPNKKFFVFSDDIEWCKNHPEELGLTCFENVEITYVNNKHEDAHLDMYLMSLGKVIIGSGSGMSRMAACVSERMEVFMNYMIKDMEIREKNGYSNKYDVGSYSKEYKLMY